MHAAAQASTIAEELLKTEYDAARLVFNRFQSAISFKPTITTVLSPDALEKEVEAGGSLDQYEVEGPDRAELLQDLGEFQLAAVRAVCAPGYARVAAIYGSLDQYEVEGPDRAELQQDLGEFQLAAVRAASAPGYGRVVAVQWQPDPA